MESEAILSIYNCARQGTPHPRLQRAWKALLASGRKLICVTDQALPVRGQNMQNIVLPMRSKPNAWWYGIEFYLRALFMLRKLNKQHTVKVHFMFSLCAILMSVLASLGQQVRTLGMLRSDQVKEVRSKPLGSVRALPYYLLEWLAVSGAQQIVTTTEPMLRAVGQRTRRLGKMTCLPNDIITPLLPIRLPRDDETTRIVTIASLDEVQNLPFMLEALTNIKHLDWEYMIVASGQPQEQDLQRLQVLATEKGIGKQVYVLKPRSDLHKMLRYCHIFVLPTLQESSPDRLLDALGYGLPCLGSNLPEIADILVDAELTFDPHFSSELTTKLGQFITSADYARNIASKSALSKAQYSGFNWEQAIMELVNNSEHQHYV